MCTVTFIPGKDSFFITSNRDESPGRSAKGLISFHPPGKNTIHYPLDQESGGSWIALSDSGRVSCLLNGAFESFTASPLYRLSRGQVVIDSVLEEDATNFLQNYHLDGIAPFTLLIFENDSFTQLIWDSKQKHITSLAKDIPQIWSSVTLYPPQVRAMRKYHFEKWLSERSEYSREAIIEFHQMPTGDLENDFIMNRNEIVKTLSITSIALKPSAGSILHLELEKNSREEILVKYE